MADFFSQIFNLLINPPGSLTYHLVLAFSVAGAIPAVLGFSRLAEATRTKRMFTGLLLLLILRVLVFGAASLAWQGLISEPLFLPLLDRVFNLLAIALILWLWAFPDPLRLADAATLLFALLIITAAVLGFLVFSEQVDPFNGSLLDILADLFALVLLSIGIVLTSIRRNTAWETGVVMLAILWLGHLAQAWLALPVDGDYPGVVRLSQLIAYPLLLVLPGRLIASTQELRVAAAAPLTHETTSELLAVLADLDEDAEEIDRCQALAIVMARLLQADICLIVTIKSDQPDGELVCGYDLIREDWLSSGHIAVGRLPLLSASIQRGQSLLLLEGNAEADALALAAMLRLETVGSVLALPVAQPVDDIARGLLLLSPYTSRQWTDQDLRLGNQVVQSLARLLQQNRRRAGLAQDMAMRENELNDTRRALDELRHEQAGLQAQLATVQTTVDYSSYTENLADLIGAYEEAQEVIARLRAENASLEGALKELGSPDGAQPPVYTLSGKMALDPEKEFLEGELRLALEEVARLNAQLSEADNRLLTLQEEITTETMLLASAARSTEESAASVSEQVTAADEPYSQTVSQRADVTAPLFTSAENLSQELRQPLASILGYTDFLLGESVGILGALQRKFLERVKAASQRMSELLDDLETTVQAGGETPPVISDEDVSLDDALDAAVAQVTGNLRERDVALRLEIAPDLPSITRAASGMQPVLTRLLENASQITPAGGEVSLRAEMRLDDPRQGYVLLQVIDQGPGIPPEYLFQLFNPDAPEMPELPGLQGIISELPSLRAQIEQLGGRIWVDNQPDQGAAFSILLPVAPEQHTGEA